MGRRLILDTGVLVALERGTLGVSDIIGADDDVAISAITVAELTVGAKLADTVNRPAREAAMNRIVQVFSVEDYTKATSEAHADLLVHCRLTGKTRGALDLIIAATAVATARSLVTLDAQADFASLPGVDVLIPQR